MPMSLINWLNDKHLEVLDIIYGEEQKDEGYVNHLLFSLYQVDYVREIQNQFVFLKHSKLQPSEIKEMQYFEWQMMLEELNDYIEKEKEAREKEEKGNSNWKDTKEYKQAQSEMKSSGFDPGKISSGNLPNFGGSNSFKLPKL